MKVQYLLDTNTSTYVIKGSPLEVRKRLVTVPMAEVGISVITEAELRFGVARKPDAARLKLAVEEFLIRVEILSWDSAAAHHYAEVRSILEREDTPMGNLGMLIAAHALAIDCVLVTHDRIFRRVKNLKTEDWTRA